MRKITIKDVAADAGVSIKTVSRVINKEKNISAETRKRVLASITRLEYRPDIAARGLAGGHSFRIGLLYDNPNASYIINIQNGVLACCRDAGFDLQIHPCEYHSASLVDEIVEMAARTRLVGLVLTPPLCDRVDLETALLENKVRFVKISPSSDDETFLSVLCDDEQAAYAMTNYLLELGHQRIAFCKGHPEHGASEKRLRGFRRALQEQGVMVEDDYLQQGMFDFESGRQCTSTLLALALPPTAIFCANDDMAAGVLYEANKRGVDVPGQLSVAGFDDTPIASQVWPSITTVRQPIEEMARKGAELLINESRQQGNGEQDYNTSFTLDFRIISRGSTAPPQ